MIDRPHRGQRVVLRYAARKGTGRRLPLHLAAGEVLATWNRRGPRNVAVRVDGVGIVIVHRGNLFVDAAERTGERQGVLWA